MTTSEFRKQAITTLKSLRDGGCTLQVRLNASNAALHAELQRLEAELIEQQTELEASLSKVYDDKEDLYQRAKAAGLTDTPMPTSRVPEVAPAGWAHKNPKLAQGPVCVYSGPTEEPNDPNKITEAAQEPAPTAGWRLLESLLFPFVLAFVLGQRYRASRQGQADHQGICHTFKAMYRQVRVRKVNSDNAYRILCLEHLLCLH